jgi:hypothetical protein
MKGNGEEKSLSRPLGIEPRLISLSIHSLVTVPTELSRLKFLFKMKIHTHTRLLLSMSVAIHWVITNVNTHVHVCMLLDKFINTFLIASPEENVTVYMFGIPRASVAVDISVSNAHRTAACFNCCTFTVVLLNVWVVPSTIDTGLNKFYWNTNISLVY